MIINAFLTVNHEEELAGWRLQIVNGEFLVGYFRDKYYLLLHQLTMDNIADCQDTLLYLQLCLNSSIHGLALVDPAVYFRTFERIIQSTADSNSRDISDVQYELKALLSAAVNLHASDLHITRGDNLAVIEFRINGALNPHSRILSGRCDELMFVLYNVEASTRETTWNRAIPQSANILYRLNGRHYRFRYAHFPIFGQSAACYHCVLRIIPSGLDTLAAPSLDGLGITAEEVADLKKILSHPYGVYVVAGTTGSGKSTTLKNLMEWLQTNRYAGKGCFLTVEDPVEYPIRGARQSSVLDAENGGFHTAIKSALRRDPDVLMVGEIRDAVSAGALAGAVESGHYCFTTVHAGSITTLLQRLSAMGISSDKLSTPGFIAGLQCQKLLPVLCPHCKTETTLPLPGGSRPVYTLNEAGCRHCRHSGILSRQLIIEYMRPTLRELEAIAGNQWLLTHKYWREKRFTSPGVTEGFDLKEKAFLHVLNGRVCFHWFSMEFGLMDNDNLEVLLAKVQ